jgi:hypothetical protein
LAAEVLGRREGALEGVGGVLGDVSDLRCEHRFKRREKVNNVVCMEMKSLH